MVVGRFPLFNPDPFDFLDDLERKEIEIPTNLSLPLQYPFYYFIVFITFSYQIITRRAKVRIF